MLRMETLSVFICEDHQIVIDGIRSILSDITRKSSVLAFSNGRDLLNALEFDEPDILILDINLPDMNGLDILKEIRKENEEMPILILTMHSDPFVVKKVKSLGGNGYLLKDFGEKEFLRALDKVLSGGYYQSPSVDIDENVNEDKHTLQLTEREKEIIRLSARGKSSNEIADELFLSPHTVNTHRRNIYKKLRISNIKELIKFAYDEGIA